MKKRISFLLTAVLAVSSCGTASYTSSSGQRFDDGLYSSPQTVDRTQLELARQESEALAKKTKESEIYLDTEVPYKTPDSGTSTIIIPENKAAVINVAGTGTTITVAGDPFDQFYYDANPWSYYRPSAFRSSYWDPWYYARYRNYYDPWYWSFRYDPWYVFDWWYYDSWYYNPWRYDPWYYDYWHWGHHHWHYHHHYCGWYGGFGHWGGSGHIHASSSRNVYFGHRSSTGFSGPRTNHRGSSVASTSSGRRVPSDNRLGVGSSSSVSRRSSSFSSRSSGTRNTATGSGRTFSSASSRRVTAGSRSGIVSTARPGTGRPSGNSSQGHIVSGSGNSAGSDMTGTLYGGRRAVQSYRGSSTSGHTSSASRGSVYSRQSNFRRPTVSGNTSNGNSAYNRSSSYRSSSSGQDYNRGSSYNSSSSSFGRSSSYRSSSSMSTRSSTMSSGSRSGYSGGSGSSSGGSSSSVRRR